VSRRRSGESREPSHILGPDSHRGPWIPAFAEILKRYIILHLGPILSNAQATELDVLRIRLCLCKIKYGGFTLTYLFEDAVFSTFYWVLLI